MRPLQSPLRRPAALLLLVVAIVHVPLIPEHLREAPYVGVLFILLVVVSAALAVLLVRSDTRIVWTATAVVMLLALVAYLVSRTVGLPQLHDDIGEWGDPLAVPSLVAEVLALAASSYIVRHPTPTPLRELT